MHKAIIEAEKQTSGEIRVHIESKAGKDTYQRALEVFEHLNMHQTEYKNGVLFYLAYKSKSFAIIADKGINDLVPEDFWTSVTEQMSEWFKQAKFSEGLIFGIQQAGEKLSAYFPYKAQSDRNELSDEISFGE